MDIEEKRSFAKRFLTAYANEASAEAFHQQAIANKHSTYATFLRARAARVDEMDEGLLDLMLADWENGAAARAAALRVNEAVHARRVIAHELWNRPKWRVVDETSPTEIVAAEPPKEVP